METHDLLTVAQAAERAGLSGDLIWREIREGRLRTIDLGFQHQSLIAPRDFEAWEATRTANGWSAADVAKFCGVSKQAVHGWVHRKHLCGHKVVGKLVFDPADVVAFAKSKGLDVDLDTHAA